VNSPKNPANSSKFANKKYFMKNKADHKSNLKKSGKKFSFNYGFGKKRSKKRSRSGSLKKSFKSSLLSQKVKPWKKNIAKELRTKSPVNMKNYKHESATKMSKNMSASNVRSMANKLIESKNSKSRTKRIKSPKMKRPNYQNWKNSNWRSSLLKKNHQAKTANHLKKLLDITSGIARSTGKQLAMKRDGYSREKQV
jgi:hypothetical protein